MSAKYHFKWFWKNAVKRCLFYKKNYVFQQTLAKQVDRKFCQVDGVLEVDCMIDRVDVYKR